MEGKEKAPPEKNIQQGRGGRETQCPAQRRHSQLLCKSHTFRQVFWLGFTVCSAPSRIEKIQWQMESRLSVYSGVTAGESHPSSLLSCGMKHRHLSAFNFVLLYKKEIEKARLFPFFPGQQEGGVDDDQDGSRIMYQRPDHRIEDSGDRQDDSDKIQGHGEGEVTFDGEHHPA